MKRILLIDDNIIEYTILAKRLAQHDIEVHWAPNIFIGKKLVKSEQHYDLVVCDMMGIGADTIEDLDFLDKDNTLVASSVVKPMNIKYEYTTKDDLSNKIVEKLNNGKRS